LKAPAISHEVIAPRILVFRDHRVILDSDLAALYDVPTKRFNEAVKRNAAKFPDDFSFQLSEDEHIALRSQFATLKTGRGQHRKYLPTVFTEHGALMAATILNSPRAVEVAVYVVRAFVQLRQVSATQRDLQQRLATLEEQTQGIASAHDSFSRNTRIQLKQLFDALRQLATPPDPPRRPIGFVTTEDKK
jgi:ORF6N domain